MIKEQLAIAGVIALGAEFMQGGEQRLKLPEILQTLDVVGSNVCLGLAWHESTWARKLSKGQPGTPELPPSKGTAAFMPNRKKNPTTHLLVDRDQNK